MRCYFHASEGGEYKKCHHRYGEFSYDVSKLMLLQGKKNCSADHKNLCVFRGLFQHFLFSILKHLTIK